MRFAYLSDVHGNSAALLAVLDEVRLCEVDAIVSGGDVVSGPDPVGALDALASVRWCPVHFVRGNADRLACSGGPHALPEDVAAGRALGPSGRAAIRGWADAVVLGGWTCVHGTPASDEGIVTALTPAAELPLGGHARVIGGHVHHQFATGGRWVCAGSVGRPYEDAPGARWALVDGDAAELRCTPYPGMQAPEVTAAQAAAAFEPRRVAASAP